MQPIVVANVNLVAQTLSLVRFSLMWKRSDRGQVPQTARPRHWPSSEPGHFFSQHVHQIQLASPDFLENLVSRLKPGSKLDFEIGDDGRAYLRMVGKRRVQPSRFERMRGTATSGLTTEEIMALTRGEG